VPLSGADNESTLDEAAIETEMFQESYHAKNYSPIGKKRIFLNQNAMTERMREDLGMNWTPSRMEKGAYATMDSNLVEDETLSYNGGDKVPPIGQPKHLPEAGQNGNLYGTTKISVPHKNYFLYFRETSESDLSAFDIGGGMDPLTGIGVDAKLGRKEEFIFTAPGPTQGYLHWEGYYDDSNIRYMFKNMGHFQFVLGGISYMQFYESDYYKQFAEAERELFSNLMTDDGGPGQMLPSTPNKIFTDYFIELETPYTKKETQMMNTSARIIQGDVHTKFLFHSPKYNEIAHVDGHFMLHETHLPCFYSYLSEFSAMQDSMTMGGKGPKNKNGQSDSSDYSLGGHYDQLTLGGLISYDNIPFFITKPGHQKPSKLDLIDFQQKQNKSWRQGKHFSNEAQEDLAYSDSFKSGAPYFENFAMAFRDLTSGGEGEYDDLATQGLYGDPSAGLVGDRTYLEDKAYYIQEYNKSIIFPRNSMRFVKEYNDKIDIFPMHTCLEIPNSSNSSFAACLEQLGMEDEFLEMVVSAAELDMMDTEQDPELISEISFTEGRHDVIPATITGMGFSNYDESFNLMDEQAYRVYNIEEFLNRVETKGPLGPAASLERNYVGPGGYQTYSKKMNEKAAAALNFQDVLKTTLFKTKLANLQKKNFRSYKDLLLGKPAYKEIVGYRVAKHLVLKNGISAKPIQNMFFMNKEDVDKIIFYDTQVKYNKQYKYIVHAYVYVVGNRYTFADAINWNTPGVVSDGGYPQTEADDKFVRVLPDDPAYNQDVLDTLGVKKEDIIDPGEEGVQQEQWQTMATDDMYSAKLFYKTLKVYNMVSPVIVEVPYYHFNGLNASAYQVVMDDPPLHPQVTFTPYREINNRLLITLETTFGDYDAKPVEILPEDGKYFSLIRMVQNKRVQEPIHYNAEDSNASYQIFRIGPNPDGNTPKPLKYSDFEKHLYKTVTTETSLSTLDDTIMRNKTYYYMFRSVDRRGGLSNPSPVYKVQLVGDPDYNLSYPKISVYDFQENQNKKNKKTFRRYLHINPTLEQITVDDESSGFHLNDTADTFDAPVIGVAKESMVGNKHSTAIEKKFKIRLTSKATGRKIDFNVKFVHRHVKNV